MVTLSWVKQASRLQMQSPLLQARRLLYPLFRSLLRTMS